MTAHAKVGGAWKDVVAISTKVSGTWKDVAEGYTKISGAWKQFFAPGGGYWLGEWTSDGTVKRTVDTIFDTTNEVIYSLVVHDNASATPKAVLVQMQYDGTINWQKDWTISFALATTTRYVSNLVLDSSQNVYVAFHNTIGLGVLKINSSGSIVTQTYVDTVNEPEFNLRITTNGTNVVVAGERYSHFIYYLNTSLSYVWQVEIDDGGTETLGNNYVGGLEIDAAGDVYVMGLMEPSTGADEDVVLYKLSASNGSIIWQTGINSAVMPTSSGFYGGNLYFQRSNRLLRVNASTGSLDTGFGRLLTGGISAIKVDPSNGSYYNLSVDDGGTNGLVWWASETSALVEQYVNRMSIAGGTAATEIAASWSDNDTIVAAQWTIPGLNAPNVIATWPKDGSYTTESVTLGSNSYTWAANATNFSSAPPASQSVTLVRGARSTSHSASSVTLGSGTLTLTKGNFS